MFWICAENSVDNIEMFLLYRGVFVTAEQCFHRVKAFSAPHTTLPVSGLGVHKELGGDTAGTADPNLTKGIFHTV